MVDFGSQVVRPSHRENRCNTDAELFLVGKRVRGSVFDQRLSNDIVSQLFLRPPSHLRGPFRSDIIS